MSEGVLPEIRDLLVEVVSKVSASCDNEGNSVPRCSCSTVPNAEDGKKEAGVPTVVTAKQRTSFKSARSGMGFLLAQLRSEHEGPKNETKTTESSEEGSSTETEKVSLKRTTQESSPFLQKRRKVGTVFRFDLARKIFQDSDSFVASAPEFGFHVGYESNNYIKCCKWNFNGSVLATSSQDRRIRFFGFHDCDSSELKFQNTVALGGLIYDMCWNEPSDFLATSSKDQPIHCWNSAAQRIVTFRGINQADELDSAQSLCFSSDGQRLYGGYNKVIRVFDMTRPGRQHQDIKTWTKVSGGQKSIISCITMNPSMNGVYATASFGKSIALYSDLSPAAECVFDTFSNAVTHIRYSRDGNLLFAAGRKEDVITCWDLRFPGQVLNTLQRPCITNQRIYFEIDEDGRYIFSGSSSGQLFVFDISQIGPQPLQPVHSSNVHRSALAGISIHPNLAMVATCSGQRIFPFPELDREDSQGDHEGGYESINSSQLFDNSVSLWTFS